MLVSVIVATRNRPEHMARFLPTILRNEYPDFEVLVIDQSTTACCEEIISGLAPAEVRYFRQEGAGKSRALNLALSQARGEMLAFTDDDCTVPPDWLYRGIAAAARKPDAGIIFGSVTPGQHDPSLTFVPAFTPDRYREVKGKWDRLCWSVVMSANMFVRRDCFDKIGGFDECLGPGARFRAAEDLDLPYRALKADITVVVDPDISLVHWGGREYADGSASGVIRASYYGMGAYLAKHVRSGDPIAAMVLIREAAQRAFAVLPAILTRRRGTGAAALVSLLTGALQGIRQPVDKRAQVFLPQRSLK